jgi:orotate phosphoribosyltransferase
MTEPAGGRAALAEALFRIGALRFGKFMLPNGKPSSYHFDLGVVPSDPEAYGLAIAACMAVAKEIGEKNFDAVAGVATAGVTISSPVAYLLKKPMLYVRRGEEGHGLGKEVEGAIRPGWRALVIDDLVTTGGGVVSAVAALRRSRYIVNDALVLVDRLEGGKENLRKADVRLRSFTDIRDLVETLFTGKMITKADREAVVRQIESGGA